jgi:hypothetical protein
MTAKLALGGVNLGKTVRVVAELGVDYPVLAPITM